MNLLERAKQEVKQKGSWLKEAELAQSIVKELPEDIQQLEMTGVDMVCGKQDAVKLDIFADYAKAEEVLSKHGLKTWTKNFSNFSGGYSLSGKAEINGIELRVCLYGTGTPLGCRVEEYQETVTRFRSICEE